MFYLFFNDFVIVLYFSFTKNLSIQNKNDYNFESETIEANNPERKFRIQTDWSDTGPNSLPYDETNNESNRLAKR